MNWNVIASVSMGALLLCASAHAQPFPAAASSTPLSGTYAVADTYYCQPTVQVNYDGTVFETAIGGIALGGPENGSALIQIAAGSLKFDASTMKVSGSLVSESGTAAIIFSTGGDGNPDFTQGTLFGQSTENVGNSSYSTASGTVTFQNITYKAFYGKKNGGVAQYAVLVGRDSQGCASRLELNHQ